MDGSSAEVGSFFHRRRILDMRVTIIAVVSYLNHESFRWIFVFSKHISAICWNLFSIDPILFKLPNLALKIKKSHLKCYKIQNRG